MFVLQFVLHSCLLSSLPYSLVSALKNLSKVVTPIIYSPRTLYVPSVGVAAQVNHKGHFESQLHGQSRG